MAEGEGGLAAARSGPGGVRATLCRDARPMCVGSVELHGRWGRILLSQASGVVRSYCEPRGSGGLTSALGCPLCSQAGRDSPAEGNNNGSPRTETAFAVKAWRLPAALESASSSFYNYELWVSALCPVSQGSAVSCT